MKKLSFKWIFIGCLISITHLLPAQTHSAYRMDLFPSFAYYDFQSESINTVPIPGYDDKSTQQLNSMGLSMKGNVSIFGFLYDEDSKFYFADYLGAHLGVGRLTFEKSYGNVSSKGFCFVGGFEFGLAAGFSISEDFEIGCKLIYNTSLVSDFEEAGTISLLPVWVPAVKLKNFQLNMGIGKGGIGGYGFKMKGAKAFTMDARYFINGSSYISIKFDRVKGSSNEVSYVVNEEATAFSIGFGLLPLAW